MDAEDSCVGRVMNSVSRELLWEETVGNPVDQIPEDKRSGDRCLFFARRRRICRREEMR